MTRKKEEKKRNRMKEEKKKERNNPKVSPFSKALVKKKKQIELGDAGTIDTWVWRFNTRFKQIIKKIGHSAN